MCVLLEAAGPAVVAAVCAVAKTPPLSLADARLMVEEMARSEAWLRLDAIEREMEAHPAAFFELPTEHLFPKDQYVRTVLMEAGETIATRIHLVEHPFFISAGRLLMWTAEDGVVEMSAPHVGLTKPGTRRLIYILEDCIFSTCHPNPDNETDPDKIVARVTYDHRLLQLKTEGAL